MPTKPITFEHRNSMARAKAVDRVRMQQPHRKLYASKQWQAVRLTVLQEQPVCNDCHRQPAAEVHHIKPVATHPELGLVRENLEGLCKPYCFTCINHQSNSVSMARFA